MKKKILAVVFLSFSNYLMAQDTTENKTLTWRVLADIYYSYDFNKPQNHVKPFFIYNYNRHNEVNLNIGLIEAQYSSKNVRANIGLMAGTYAQYNLAAEQELLRHIYEANIGIKISKTNNVWIDAGIMPSHIGYESLISTDNWTLTKSITGDNTPFFEAGAKISCISKNEKVLLSGMLLNGWQRIQRQAGNNTPAFGTQLVIKPNDKTTLNWSTYIGNDKPDSLSQWRYFNNFYATFQLNNKLAVTLGFDIGGQQKSKGSSKLNTWYSPTIVIRYTLNDNWSVALRGEYFNDRYGIIIPTNTINGFKTNGASLNVDRKFYPNFWWRTEIRTLNSKDAIFQKGNLFVMNDFFITTSFVFSFR